MSKVTSLQTDSRDVALIITAANYASGFAYSGDHKEMTKKWTEIFEIAYDAMAKKSREHLYK